MKSNIFEKVLNDVSLDPRIKDGTFRIEENDHMDILREYFVGKGLDESAVIEFCNKVLEGKYPERQAYNAKGILVTFPTPEYKAAAIKRGTHFEDDPTRKAANIFQTSQPAAAPKQPTEPKAGEKKTSLPLSQSDSTPAPAPEDDTTGPAAQPAAPMPPPEPQATTVAPQQSDTTVEPAPEPTELPPPEEKSDVEKLANKSAIKQMLKGDDYMLEEVVDWIVLNGSTTILENIKRRL